MDNLTKLEFYEILEKLKSFCVTFMGKHIASNLRPTSDSQKVQQLLLETGEAVSLMERFSSPYFSEVVDITPHLKRIESAGVLKPEDILQVVQIFILTQNLKEYFDKDYIDEKDYPILSILFHSFYTNKQIIEKISTCITQEATIEDKATRKIEHHSKK